MARTIIIHFHIPNVFFSTNIYFSSSFFLTPIYISSQQYIVDTYTSYKWLWVYTKKIVSDTPNKVRNRVFSKIFFVYTQNYLFFTKNLVFSLKQGSTFGYCGWIFLYIPNLTYWLFPPHPQKFIRFVSDSFSLAWDKFKVHLFYSPNVSKRIVTTLPFSFFLFWIVSVPPFSFATEFAKYSPRP